MAEGNSPPIDDHDRLVRLEAEFAASAKRMDEFVEWKHQQLPPIIMGMQKDQLEQAKATATLRGEISSLCSAIDKLATTVQTLLGVPLAFAEHEGACIRARNEDIMHRDRHETWVAGQFAGIRSRQIALHGTVGVAMLTALGSMGWYIMTHFHGGLP